MILTVTMNPSLDISYPLEEFHLNDVNRCKEVSKTAGGKGLNVSRVIHLMEEKVLATGIVGGFIGEFIQKELNHMQIPYNFFKISQESRNCIALLHNGMQTEVLESGPTITNEQSEGFYSHFKTLLKDIHVVTISGSLPEGIDSDYYNRLIEACAKKDIPVLLDSSGSYLEEALRNVCKPYLIKPNIDELKHLTGTTERAVTKADLIEILELPLFDDVPVIVISMGKNGSFVKWKDTYYDVQIPEIKVVNPVGSGDSTIAGLAIGLANKLSIDDTLKTAMVTGMLNTMEEKTGYINKTKFNTYFDKVTIKKIMNKRAKL